MPPVKSTAPAGCVFLVFVTWYFALRDGPLGRILDAVRDVHAPIREWPEFL